LRLGACIFWNIFGPKYDRILGVYRVYVFQVRFYCLKFLSWSLFFNPVARRIVPHNTLKNKHHRNSFFFDKHTGGRLVLMVTDSFSGIWGQSVMQTFSYKNLRTDFYSNFLKCVTRNWWFGVPALFFMRNFFNRHANAPFVKKWCIKSRLWRSIESSVGVLRFKKCNNMRYFHRKKVCTHPICKSRSAIIKF
jgi:hypothetical protein